jgi:hypothetical protein
LGGNRTCTSVLLGEVRYVRLGEVRYALMVRNVLRVLEIVIARHWNKGFLDVFKQI